MPSLSSSLSFSVCAIIFISIGYSTAELVCGPNSSVDKCPKDCSYDYCPTKEIDDNEPCIKPATCPQPNCACDFNYRKASRNNNTCIPTRECPPFECTGPNEIFDPCPSYCPGDECSNANPTGECPFISLLVVECNPSCRCIPHFWRSNGTCVPYLECPGVKEALENGNNDTEIINYFLK